MAGQNTDIQSVQDLLQRLSASPLAALPDAHARVWFRGQPNYSWKLVPGVYRPDFPEQNEHARLNLERRLAQDFRAMSASIRRGDEGEAELYFLQQHYRMWTRLLDWTNNALAALYFAVSSDQEKDAALFAMDAHALGLTQQASFTYLGSEVAFEGIADSRHPLFTEALKVVFHWYGQLEFPNFIFPVRPDFFDRRITLQRGCFTFHVPNRSELTVQENSTLVSYRIPAGAKQVIRRDLMALGIDDFSIYGDMDHLSNRLKEAYRTRP